MVRHKKGVDIITMVWQKKGVDILTMVRQKKGALVNDGGVKKMAH